MEFVTGRVGGGTSGGDRYGRWETTSRNECEMDGGHVKIGSGMEMEAGTCKQVRKKGESMQVWKESKSPHNHNAKKRRG